MAYIFENHMTLTPNNYTHLDNCRDRTKSKRPVRNQEPTSNKAPGSGNWFLIFLIILVIGLVTVFLNLPAFQTLLLSPEC